jgi:hypothetical protein
MNWVKRNMEITYINFYVFQRVFWFYNVLPLVFHCIMQEEFVNSYSWVSLWIRTVMRPNWGFIDVFEVIWSVIACFRHQRPCGRVLVRAHVASVAFCVIWDTTTCKINDIVPNNVQISRHVFCRLNNLPKLMKILICIEQMSVYDIFEIHNFLWIGSWNKYNLVKWSQLNS